MIVLAIYFFYEEPSSQSFEIPPEYTGSRGLDYIRDSYSSQLSQARTACSSYFKGEWRDNSNTIGCYNMQDFSTSYCGTDIIQNLVDLCNSIRGNPVCTSTQASCSV